jgi:putative ABC transport system permease protein
LIRNHLKIAFRNLLRHKVFSFINIAGLAVSMAACILIIRYVHYEMTYESSNRNAESVYRIQVNRYQNSELQFKSARSYPGLFRLINNSIPEVKYSTRLYPEDCLFKYGDKKISGQAVLWVDDPFLKIFDIELIKKTSSEPLKNTYTTVITETAAKRFFGSENPIGKTIILNEGVPFIVNGVCKDYPANTHFKFDFLLNMNTIGALDGYDIINTVYYNWAYNYIMLKPGADPKQVENKLAGIINTHFTYLAESNSHINLVMQPLADIHLHSDLSEEIAPNGSMDIVWYLLLIAFLILVIAWINFVNLTTARSLERAREVGVRKVIGANRGQIIKQFLFETSIVNIAAFILAVLLSELLVQYVNSLTGHDLSITNFSGYFFWLTVLAVFAVSGIASALYPAFLLSSFRPADVIKGKLGKRGKGQVLRRVLIIFQFASATALITTTIIIGRQIDYVTGLYPGFSNEQVLVINTPRSLINNPARVQYFDRFKSLLKENPAVKNVSASDVVPGKEIVFHLENLAKLGSESKNISFSGVNADWDLFDVLGIRFAAGRAFSKYYPSDSSAIVMNESACKMLGFNSPAEAINNYAVDPGNNNRFKIVGVVKDYHQEHFKKSVEPVIYFQGHGYQFGYFPDKLYTKDFSAAVSFIKKQWEEVYPADPFDYFFLDEFFNEQYKSDRQFGNIVSIFSTLAIFIALIGLLGLSSLMTVQRTKEIGIRKVLGASIPVLLFQLSGEFIIMITLSFIAAWPLTYYVMNGWLESFSESISLNILYFLLPALFILAVSAGVISLQAFKTARENPVKSLKYE